MSSYLVLGPGTPNLLTPFESWCERRQVSPEAVGAWEVYQREARPLPAESGRGAA